MSPFVALFGHGAMSDLSPLCAPKRTSTDHSEFMGSRPGQADVANQTSDGGRQAGQGSRVAWLEADEWRTVYDSPFDVTRARDLLIEFVGGEASEQLRDQFV
jgi:hypothetical protein